MNTSLCFATTFRKSFTMASYLVCPVWSNTYKYFWMLISVSGSTLVVSWAVISVGYLAGLVKYEMNF